MKTLLALLFSILCGTEAYGQTWSLISRDGDTNAIYLDEDSLELDRGRRRISVLGSYSEATSTGAMSVLLRVEFDCGMEQWRSMYYVEFAEPMAKGAETFQDRNVTRWFLIERGSVEEYTFLLVCGA
jgi:hypothetical protein